jgi:hypothetical protein
VAYDRLSQILVLRCLPWEYPADRANVGKK